MDLKISVIVGLVIGIILLGAMLPTALTAFYKTKTDVAGHEYGFDSHNIAIATDLNVTNDLATSAIFKLFPLFAALGGVVLLIGIGLKHSGYI